MSRGVRYSLVAAVAALLAVVPACGKKSGKVKVAVVTNCTAEFWSICEAGAKKAAADFDVDVIFRQPDKNEVSTQMEIVEAVRKQGISGIAVSVINPAEQTPDLRRIAKETHFLAMDNDAPESGRLCYIGIDNYEAGKAVGRLVKEAMPQGGTVALFIGGTDSANAKGRVGGVLDELAGTKDAKGPMYGKYELLDNEPKTDKTKEETAQDNAKDVLNKLTGKNKSLCLVGLYAYNPKANVLAVRAMKDKQFTDLKLVGFDEDYVTLDAIEKGEIVGTVVQDPYEYGYQAVRVLAAVARGDKAAAEGFKSIPYRIITKNGGDKTTVNGMEVLNLKATDFGAQLKERIAAGKK